MKTIHRTILSSMIIGSACSDLPDMEDLLPHDTHDLSHQSPAGDWPELSTTDTGQSDWPDSGSGTTTDDPSASDTSNPTASSESNSDNVADSGDSSSTTTENPEDPDNDDSTASNETGEIVDHCRFLQISEFMADPEGKDGSAEGPEWVEILNQGASSVPLEGCVLASRSWPELSLGGLLPSTNELRSGQQLTVYRFNKDVEIPPLPASTPSRIDVAFRHNNGLRNVEGALGIRGSQGSWVDLVVYGGPQSPPFDDSMAWTGSATVSPSAGLSLCRGLHTTDSNSAADWFTCPPSPGLENPSFDEDPNPEDSSDSETGSDSEAGESESAESPSSSSEESASTDESSETSGESMSDESSSDTKTDTGTSSESSSDTGDNPDSASDSGDSEETDSDSENSEDPGPLSIVIATVLSNPVGPASEDKFHEYIDIVNIGPDEVTLKGWTIADDLDINAKGIDPILYRSGSGGCNLADLCLAPGRRARIAGSEYFENEAAPDLLILQTDDTTIADGGMTALEPIVLRDSNAAIRSTYRAWLDPKATPNPSKTETAITRIELGEGDLADNWQFVSSSPTAN